MMIFYYIITTLPKYNIIPSNRIIIIQYIRINKNVPITNELQFTEDNSQFLEHCRIFLHTQLVESLK